MKKLLFLTIMMTAVAIASAQVINVPGDYGTIQEGIDAASHGDTVLVEAGTYYENVFFRGKAIFLTSNYIFSTDSSDIYNTIIDGSQAINSDSASCVMFMDGEDTTSVLCGFTITNGSGTKYSSLQAQHGGGICGYNSGGKIIHNIITDNTVMSDGNALGGGISFLTSSGQNWLVIKENIIQDNSAEAVEQVALGGGIYSSINTIIIKNNISNNISMSDSSEGDGGGIGCHSLFTQEGILLLNNNMICNNYTMGAYTYGVGVFVRYYTVTIKENFINYNHSDVDKYWGIGVNIIDPSGKVYVLNNEFRENIGTIPASPGAGGGLSIRDPYEELVLVDGNLFINNVGKHGAGFYSRRPHNTVLSNNIFIQNSAEVGGAVGLYMPLSDQIASSQDLIPVLVNNTFKENHAQFTGGAIRITGDEGDGLLTFNNIFTENTAGTGEDIFNNSSNYNVWIHHSNIDENNIYGLWEGDNNFPGDPGIIDDSCHINGGICHNTGIHEIVAGGITFSAPEIDFDGDPRPQGPSWDVGADECLMVGIAGIEADSETLNLKVNPNPSSGALHLRYLIADNGYLIADIYSVNGVKVKTLFQGYHQPGKHDQSFNISDLPNGIYFIRLQAGENVETAKVILMK